MEKILGIGGVFMRFRDKQATALWYRDNLGLDVNEHWLGAVLPLRDERDKPTAQVVWGTFDPDSTYFGRLEQQVMINFRVADLDAMVAQLRANGCDVDDRVERNDFGGFAWVTDPEGNRIELWEPPEVSPQV